MFLEENSFLLLHIILPHINGNSFNVLGDIKQYGNLYKYSKYIILRAFVLNYCHWIDLVLCWFSCSLKLGFMSWEKAKVCALSVPSFIACVPRFSLPSKVFADVQEAQDWLLMCWLLPLIVLKGLATPLQRLFHSFYIFSWSYLKISFCRLLYMCLSLKVLWYYGC